MVDLGEDERGKRRGAGGCGRGVFSQDGSAVGDAGAVIMLVSVKPGKEMGGRTKGVGWRRMRKPSRWPKRERKCKLANPSERPKSPKCILLRKTALP